MEEFLLGSDKLSHLMRCSLVGVQGGRAESRGDEEQTDHQWLYQHFLGVEHAQCAAARQGLQGLQF